MRHFLLFILSIQILLAQSLHEPHFYNLEIACQIHPSAVMPKPEADGRIQTLNQKGAVSPAMDLARSSWLDAIKWGDKVLDIGGAFGDDTIKALEKGAICHLLDMGPRHLGVAARRIEELIRDGKLSAQVRNSVFFIEADISKPFKFFATQYNHILVARVLHFFNPQQIRTALINIEHMTMPGGGLHIVAITPYVERFKSFIPQFEENKKEGLEFPGYVGGLLPWVNRDVTTPKQIKNLHQGTFMFLDRDVLTRVLKEAGFDVLHCAHYPLGYQSKSWATKDTKVAGQENVVAIARKPLKSKL